MIPDEVIVPCLVWVFMEYFSLVPLLSFHRQLQNLHYFLCLNIAPYIPPMIIHVQLFLCLYTRSLMRWTSLIRTVWPPFLIPELLKIWPGSPAPTSPKTLCYPTCLIPIDIKFGMLCDKIDVVNKAFPYVIKFLSRVVSVLSFFCCCVIVAEFL